MTNKIVILVCTIAIAWQFWFPVRKPQDTLVEECDFVIVGAGSAGGIVAARLSEDPYHEVALLEAGPDNSEYPRADIPAEYLPTIGTSVDWQYFTEPQKHSCKGLVDKRSSWPRGRALGGSSLINAMMVTHGNKEDYDLWARMGNKEWSSEKILPYMKKIERVTKPEWIMSDFRGKSGPTIISEIDIFPKLTSAFLTAVKVLGFKVKDINDYEQTGWMAYQANIGNGVRQSTAVSYIKPAMKNPNLHVITKAHATKVLFEGKRAIGIQYVHDGRLKQIRARKEVIISAGSIGSPQILMLSGVGPKEHLSQLNIPVISDLPVGKNLYDHVMSDTAVNTYDQNVGLKVDRIGLMDQVEYNLFGTGVMSTCGVAGTGFAYTSTQPKDEKNPMLQFIFYAANSGTNEPFLEIMRNVFNIEQEVFYTLYGGLTHLDGAVLLPQLLQPYSVGEIRLKSTNPFDYPLIDPNYLSDERDVRILIEGVRIAQKIMDSPAMKAIGGKTLKRVHPLCKNHTYDSDDYWECYLRSNTITVYHPVGTCKMGPDGDPTSVVDSELRVRNVEGLRVVDGSIMPYITSGNTNFPIMMIAEKAADLIRKHYHNKDI